MLKNIELTHEDPLMIPSIEWQLKEYLGYSAKVWRILRDPQTEKEDFCKDKIVECLAKRWIARARAKRLSIDPLELWNHE